MKVVEDTPILSATEMIPNNLVSSGKLLTAIFAEVTENECSIYAFMLTLGLCPSILC